MLLSLSLSLSLPLPLPLSSPSPPSLSLNSRNYLQSIPPELCRMNLFSLNLSNNRLVSLPVELGKLSSLQFLVSWILEPY